MKIQYVNMISVVIVFIISCGTEMNNSSEKQAENMLLEYYTKHFQIWEIPSLPSNVRYEKLDSLMQKYCTTKLRNEAREVFENVGADFLTNDLIGNINENLKVERDTIDKNGYIVSFISDIATYLDAPGEQTKKQVTIHVTVIMEGGSYKINSVR
jgi:hypothetical protein